MLTTIQNQSNIIENYQKEFESQLKDIEEDHNKLTGEMSQKEIELQDMCDLLEEKEETIQELTESLEEESKTVTALRRQIATAANQLNDANEVFISKQKEVVELEEKLEVKEIQVLHSV